jgi:homocysteine S-methyltransferase
VYPNSGEKWNAGSQDWSGTRNQAGFGELAAQWVDVGASLVGGCCRIGPREIASLAAAFRVFR